MNTLVPAAIGYFYGGINYIYPALIFIGFGRALQQQMTFCVNSICHMFGKRRHANDTSGDIWMLWPLLLGENWHNFHHAFGNDYRCGHKWYYFDVHKWIIWTLSKVGLAKNLVVTSDARIAAKEREMNEFLVSQTLSLFDKVGISVQSLLDKIPSRLSTLSNELKDIDIKSFGKAKAKQSEQKLLGGINALSARLVALQSKIAKIVNNTEFEASKMANKFGEKLLHSCMTEFDKLHKRAQKLGIV